MALDLSRKAEKIEKLPNVGFGELITFLRREKGQRYVLLRLARKYYANRAPDKSLAIWILHQHYFFKTGNELTFAAIAEKNSLSAYQATNLAHREGIRALNKFFKDQYLKRAV